MEVCCFHSDYIALGFFAIAYHPDLAQNSTLNSRAAAEANIGGTFGLENFTYNNTSILKTLSGHLNRTDFLGITVRQTQPDLFDCNLTATCFPKYISDDVGIFSFLFVHSLAVCVYV